MKRVVSLRDRHDRLLVALIAVQMFDELHHQLPSSVIRDEAGRELGSWRMAVCPCLPDPPAVDATKPWYDQRNESLSKTPLFPFCFANSETKTPETNIVAVVGPDTAFGTQSRIQFSDLPADLIVLVETAPRGINWMAPGDLDVDALPNSLTRGTDGDGFFVAFWDQTVWHLDKTTPLHLIRSFCTIKGASELNRDVDLQPYVRYGW